jgi:hypothetical protein
MFNFTELSTNQLVLILIAIIWTTIWKGIGLWKSAQKKHKGWFIAFLLINTLGILPIIYINWFQNKKH